MKPQQPEPRRRPALRVFAAVTSAYLAGAVLFSSASMAEPPIYVDGSKIAVAAIERNDQVFVPVRGVFEKLNTAVDYAPPRSITARKSNSDVAKLMLGSRDASVNGTARTLDTAPFRSGARVYVPLRLVSEASGATVVYSAATHAVNITGARAVVAAVAPVVVASPVDTAAPATQQQGIPWWVWLLLALIVLAILLAFFLRRKPEPVIKTRSSSSDPKITTRR